MLPTKRYVLLSMNAHKAHSRIEFNGWSFDDIVYEDDGNKTTNIKYLHHFESNPDNKVVINDDRELGFIYLDLYGVSPEAINSIEDRITYYTEADIKKTVEAGNSEDQIVSNLMLVGLSATCHPKKWKQEFITDHIKQGSQRVRMTAILAAILATHAEYTKAVKAVMTDEDRTLREYARDMLESVRASASMLVSEASGS